MGWKKGFEEGLLLGKDNISLRVEDSLLSEVSSPTCPLIVSLFRFPMKVKLRLHKIQRDFLWGGGSPERKFHLINWDSVSHSKEKGGLGIFNLSTFNSALLGKWCWRFTMEDSSTWRSVINLKYGSEFGGWFRPIPKSCHGLVFGRKLAKKV